MKKIEAKVKKNFCLRGVDFLKGDIVVISPKKNCTDPDIRDLMQDLVMKKRGVIKLLKPKRKKRTEMECEGVYISVNGLASLAEAGVQIFEQETGHYLPHNLVRGEMSGSLFIRALSDLNEHPEFEFRLFPPGSYFPVEEAKRVITSYGRFGGWLKAAIHLPAVRRLIEKTQDRRGINSFHTKADLWEVVEKFPSPGKLEKLLWAVRRRAEVILSSYGKNNPAWADIINALLSNASVGKAAIIATAVTMGMDPYDDKDPSNPRRKAYKEAREWLLKNRRRNFPNVNNIRGETVWVKNTPEIFEKEVKIFQGLKINQYGQRTPVWIIHDIFDKYIMDKEKMYSSTAEEAFKLAARDLKVKKALRGELEITSINKVPPMDEMGIRRLEVELKISEEKGSFSVELREEKELGIVGAIYTAEGYKGCCIYKPLYEKISYAMETGSYLGELLDKKEIRCILDFSGMFD